MTFRPLGDRRLVAALVVVLVAAAVSAGMAFGAGPASPGQGRGPEHDLRAALGEVIRSER
jgi:hypothetical protein